MYYICVVSCVWKTQDAISRARAQLRRNKKKIGYENYRSIVAAANTLTTKQHRTKCWLCFCHNNRVLLTLLACVMHWIYVVFVLCTYTHTHTSNKSQSTDRAPLAILFPQSIWLCFAQFPAATTDKFLLFRLHLVGRRWAMRFTHFGHRQRPCSKRATNSMHRRCVCVWARCKPAQLKHRLHFSFNIIVSLHGKVRHKFISINIIRAAIPIEQLLFILCLSFFK